MSIKCKNCGADLTKSGGLLKNVVYDTCSVKRVKGGIDVDYKKHIEQGECDPMPDLICPECCCDPNERLKE